jgi:hypothetical protein
VKALTLKSWTDVSILLGGLLIASAALGQLPGQVIVDPDNASWFRYHQGGSLFLCAPGEPEDFLYRGSQNANGTRNGDQGTLLARLGPTGANGVYLQAVRSHGGDDPTGTHNPFIDNDKDKGLNQAVLDEWEGWFDTMDQNGVVIFFIFYDDSARLWGFKGSGLAPEESTFVSTLVDRFEHHKHLIWVVAEEYEERWTTAEASQLAGIIKATDDNNHPVAVHQHSGLGFDFPNDPNVDQFAIQHGESDPDSVHADMVSAWSNANGRYNLNLAEPHRDAWGTGALARHNSWATALGGAYIMHIDWDIAGTPVARLNECGHLRSFMEFADLSSMAPDGSLASGSTKYVMANPGTAYIAYTRDSGNLGIKNLPSGRPLQRWLDTVTGAVVEVTHSIGGGNTLFSRPGGIGTEAALYLLFEDDILAHGFESGNTSAWSRASP